MWEHARLQEYTEPARFTQACLSRCHPVDIHYMVQLRIPVVFYFSYTKATYIVSFVALHWYRSPYHTSPSAYPNSVLVPVLGHCDELRAFGTCFFLYCLVLRREWGNGLWGLLLGII